MSQQHKHKWPKKISGSLRVVKNLKSFHSGLQSGLSFRVNTAEILWFILHPSILSLYLLSLGIQAESRVAGAYPSIPFAERQGTPCTGCQSIQSHSHYTYWQIRLSSWPNLHFLGLWEETSADTSRAQTQRQQVTCCCEETVLTFIHWPPYNLQVVLFYCTQFILLLEK